MKIDKFSVMRIPKGKNVTLFSLWVLPATRKGGIMGGFPLPLSGKSAGNRQIIVVKI
jgi:hypothetical protein